jgi:hypothetical protein
MESGNERQESEASRRRLLAGYIIAGALVVAVVVGLVVVLTGGDDEGGSGTTTGATTGTTAATTAQNPDNAHVDPLTGSTDELELDGREGTPPPAPELADLEQAAEAANCELQLDLKDEGNGHFTDDTTAIDYGTNPPTSGDHYGVATEPASGAMADGAYAETPPPPRFVHSLEHGRVEIQYSSSLSEDDQLELKGVFDEDPVRVLLFPNDEMPFEVAATAWTQLMGCPTYEGAVTLDAVRAFRDIYRDQGPESF